MKDSAETQKSNRGRKTNTVVYEQRMTRVFEMMLYERLNSIEFRNKASKEFGITTRQAEILWKDAKDRLKKKFEDEQEELLSSHIQRYFDLLKRAKDGFNKRVEREVLADLTKLMGLEQTKKVDITSGGEKINVNIILDN